MQYQHENFRRNYGDSHFQQPPHHSQGQGNGPQLSQTHHGRHNPMKHYEQYRPHEPPQYTQYQHSPYVPNAHQTQIQRQHPHATPQQTTGNWTSTASDGGYFPEELHTTEQQSRIGLQTFVQQRDEWHSQQLRQSYANEQQSHPLRSPNQRSPNQMQPPPVLSRPSEGLGLKLRQEQCPGPICITNVDDYGLVARHTRATGQQVVAPGDSVIAINGTAVERLEQAIALVKSSTGSSSTLSIVLRSGREGRVYAITLPRGNSSSGEGATRGSMKDDSHPSQVTSLVTSRAFEREPDKPKPESVPWLRSEPQTGQDSQQSLYSFTKSRALHAGSQRENQSLSHALSPQGNDFYRTGASEPSKQEGFRRPYEHTGNARNGADSGGRGQGSLRATWQAGMTGQEQAREDKRNGTQTQQRKASDDWADLRSSFAELPNIDWLLQGGKEKKEEKKMYEKRHDVGAWPGAPKTEGDQVLHWLSIPSISKQCPQTPPCGPSDNSSSHNSSHSRRRGLDFVSTPVDMRGQVEMRASRDERYASNKSQSSTTRAAAPAPKNSDSCSSNAHTPFFSSVGVIDRDKHGFDSRYDPNGGAREIWQSLEEEELVELYVKKNLSDTPQRPGSPSASHCHTPSFLLPQLTPTSTRISTLENTPPQKDILSAGGDPRMGKLGHLDSLPLPDPKRASFSSSFWEPSPNNVNHQVGEGHKDDRFWKL